MDDAGEAKRRGVACISVLENSVRDDGLANAFEFDLGLAPEDEPKLKADVAAFAETGTADDSSKD